MKNYIEIFTSKVTVLSFKNTFLYALIVVPSVLVIGTVLAVFVNQKIKGVQVFRLIYFSPQVVTKCFTREKCRRQEPNFTMICSTL